MAFINSLVLVHRQVFTEGLLPALCHMRTAYKTAHRFCTKGLTALPDTNEVPKAIKVKESESFGGIRAWHQIRQLSCLTVT